jgi:pyruvate,orthophosphate dikinase
VVNQATAGARLATLLTQLAADDGTPEDSGPTVTSISAVPVKPYFERPILNLGINDAAVQGLAAESGNPRFAWDSYRRFVQMFGEVVLGVPSDDFEHALSQLKKARGVKNDTDLSAEDLQELVAEVRDVAGYVEGHLIAPHDH